MRENVENFDFSVFKVIDQDTMTPILATDKCPCQSGDNYEQCCLPIIRRTQPAKTAEALMRSRYTAFTLCDDDYLRHSWHPDFCPNDIHTKDDNQWLGLRIKSTSKGAECDHEGHVHFVARYKNNGKAVRIEENSLFQRFEGRWVYVRGE